MKINNSLVFLLCILLFTLAMSIYMENGKEGFVIQAIGGMVNKRINRKYRPLRRNLKRHANKLTEDFEKMVNSISKN